MIEIESINLKNIVTHKDTSFKFNKGVSIVRGQNGSGKSVLFSTLSNVLYSNPPLSTKKNQARTMFPKQGAIQLKIKNKNRYDLKQYSKGRSLKYDIQINNKSFQTHTISSALKIINNIFPLTENQFYSTTYLNAYRSASHILLNGSGPQRKEFFETFFGLFHYDNIYARLRKRLSEIKYKVASEEEILEEYKHLESNLHKINHKKVKEKEHKITTLTNKYNEYKDNLNKINTYKNIKDRIKYPLRKCNKWEKKLTQQLNNLEKEAREYNKQMHINALYEESIKKKKEISSKISEYNPCNVELLRSLYKQITSKYNEIVKDLDKVKQDKKDYTKKKHLASKLPSKLLEIDYDVALQKHKQLLHNMALQDRLHNLKGHKECPTCNSPLRTKDIDALIKKCTKDLEKYKIYGNTNLSILREYKGIKVVFNKDKYNKLKSQISQLIYLRKAFNKVYEQQNKLESLKERLNNIPVYEYKQVDKPDEQKIKTKKTELLQVQKDLSNYEVLSQIDVDLDNEEVYKKFIENNKDLPSELTKLGKLKAQVEENIKNKARIKELKEKLASIKKHKTNLKYYEALCKAYGPRGIRNLQIENLAQLYATQLNQHSNLIFTEDIKFEVFVDSNNFNILATRDGLTADVQTLSGAQSRCFQLLNLFVLRTLIPEVYKTDTVIADEMESGMGKKRKHLFANKYIPALAQLVDKIVIITPQSIKEFYIPNAKEYKVVKKDKFSKILGK